MIIFLAISTASVLAISSSASASVHDVSLCKSDEVEIASCQMEGEAKKILSFCATRQSELVSYRFGRRERIELSIEFSADKKIYRWKDMDTYTTFVGFNNDGYSYVFGVPQEVLNAKAFLLVKRVTAPLDFSLPRFCVSNSFGDKDLVSDVIEDVDDIAVRNNGFFFPPYIK